MNSVHSIKVADVLGDYPRYFPNEQDFRRGGLQKKYAGNPFHT